jgi:hypothetical protein
MWSIIVFFIKETFFMHDEGPASIFRVDGSNLFLSDDKLLPGIISHPARLFSIRRGHCQKMIQPGGNIK